MKLTSNRPRPSPEREVKASITEREEKTHIPPDRKFTRPDALCLRQLT